LSQLLRKLRRRSPSRRASFYVRHTCRAARDSQAAGPRVAVRSGCCRSIRSGTPDLCQRRPRERRSARRLRPAVHLRRPSRFRLGHLLRGRNADRLHVVEPARRCQHDRDCRSDIRSSRQCPAASRAVVRGPSAFVFGAMGTAVLASGCGSRSLVSQGTAQASVDASGLHRRIVSGWFS
jgi:hypothetical protein